MPPGSRRRSELATPTNEQIGSISGDQYISISDFIYLHDEALGGFISVEGFTDMQLAIEMESTLVGEHDFGHHAVFRLMPQQMYTMAKQLRAFDAQPAGGSLGALAERDLRRRELEEEVRREKAHNEGEVANSAGREVRYGKVLQLQHVASGKLQRLTPRPAGHWPAPQQRLTPRPTGHWPAPHSPPTARRRVHAISGAQDDAADRGEHDRLPRGRGAHHRAGARLQSPDDLPPPPAASLSRGSSPSVFGRTA